MRNAFSAIGCETAISDTRQEASDRAEQSSAKSRRSPFGRFGDILSGVHESYAEINDCKYLFLTEISELGRDGLRLRVEEGRPAGETEDIRIGGSVISGGTRIDVRDDSRIFEVFWASYVAYSVLNESFALQDAAEVYEGGRMRLYSKSNFADYLSKATFACNEYPGPTLHYEVSCEDHIIDVVSVVSPIVRRLR